MFHKEHKLQQAVAVYLSKALPPDAVFNSIDAAFKGDAVIGAIRKARGVKAGWPDIEVIYRGKFHGIELKAGTSLSDAQARIGAAICDAGGEYDIAYSLDDVEILLRRWGIPLKATTLTTQEIDARLAAPKPAGKASRPRRTPLTGQGRKMAATYARLLPK